MHHWTLANVVKESKDQQKKSPNMGHLGSVFSCHLKITYFLQKVFSDKSQNILNQVQQDTVDMIWEYDSII